MWNQSSTWSACGAADDEVLVAQRHRRWEPLLKCFHLRRADGAQARPIHCFGAANHAAIATKAKLVACPSSSSTLPAITSKSLVPTPDVSTLQADNSLFTRIASRAINQNFRRLLKPLAHLHRPVPHSVDCCLRRYWQKLPEKVCGFTERQ